MKLKILGQRYDAFIENNMYAHEGTEGLHHQKTQIIRVDKNLKPNAIEECLMHEIIEALNHRLEIKLEHPQITQISESLYQVLKDNGFLNMSKFHKGDK